MDRIREEFERFLIEDNMEYHNFAMKCKRPNKYNAALGFIAGYKSRDEEIKKLRGNLEIVLKSLIAKDYIAAIEILSEILEGE